MSGPQVTNTDDILVANDPEFFGDLDALYAKTWAGEAIPAKYKELIGVSASIIIRCEPCLRHHIKMAVEGGATRAELTEEQKERRLAIFGILVSLFERAYLLVPIRTLAEAGDEMVWDVSWR